MIMKWIPGLDPININSQVGKIFWEKKELFLEHQKNFWQDFLVQLAGQIP